MVADATQGIVKTLVAVHRQMLTTDAGRMTSLSYKVDIDNWFR